MKTIAHGLTGSYEYKPARLEIYSGKKNDMITPDIGSVCYKNKFPCTVMINKTKANMHAGISS